MPHEPANAAAHPTHLHQGADGTDYLTAAFNHLRGILSECGGSPWKVSTPRQETGIREWAKSMGLLLNAESILPYTTKGGMEHDLLKPLREGRLWKVTKKGYFGFMPGLELELVPQGADGRRFHLWESGIYHYLERLVLQNTLFGLINRLEGFVANTSELIAVISQPAYELIAVTQNQIDQWFLAQRFERIADASYYRRADNIAIFDAHDKNVTWDGESMVPFDVIPCRPDGGFLDFIEKVLAEGQQLQTRRISRTTDTH